MPSGYPCFQERSSCINIESNFPYQSQYTKYGKKNTSTQVRCHETLSLSQKQKRKHNFKKRAIDVFIYHLHSFQQENRKLKKCKFCYGRCGSDKKPIEKSRLASPYCQWESFLHPEDYLVRGFSYYPDYARARALSLKRQLNCHIDATRFPSRQHRRRRFVVYILKYYFRLLKKSFVLFKISRRLIAICR